MGPEDVVVGDLKRGSVVHKTTFWEHIIDSYSGGGFNIKSCKIEESCVTIWTR